MPTSGTGSLFQQENTGEQNLRNQSPLGGASRLESNLQASKPAETEQGLMTILFSFLLKTWHKQFKIAFFFFFFKCILVFNNKLWKADGLDEKKNKQLSYSHMLILKPWDSPGANAQFKQLKEINTSFQGRAFASTTHTFPPLNQCPISRGRETITWNAQRL